MLLRGTTYPAIQEPVTRRVIASVNTFTLLNTKEQVYSHTVEFPWLDERGNVSYDWAKFCKKSILKRIGEGAPFALVRVCVPS